MYTVKKYYPVSGSRVDVAFIPMRSIISTHSCYLRVRIVKLPCGRRMFVTPSNRNFYVNANSFFSSPDVVFQSVNSFYNALLHGGWLYRLDCSRTEFYALLRTDYREGYNRD